MASDGRPSATVDDLVVLDVQRAKFLHEGFIGDLHVLAVLLGSIIDVDLDVMAPMRPFLTKHFRVEAEISIRDDWIMTGSKGLILLMPRPRSSKLDKYSFSAMEAKTQSEFRSLQLRYPLLDAVSSGLIQSNGKPVNKLVDLILDGVMYK